MQIPSKDVIFDQFSSQFQQITRSFAIRYLSSLKEKSPPTQSFQELQIQLSKILSPILSGQLDGNIITKLLGLQLKGDYQQVLALSFLQDLSKLTREIYDKVSLQQGPKGSLIIMGIFQTIVTESLRVLNSQQQFHTIVPKQNEVLRQLLLNPYLINSPSIQNYRIAYRKLKDIKQFYPQTVKQQQKLTFLKAVEQSIEQITKYDAIKLLEFLFNNLLNELETLQPSHDLVTSRLKLIKKIIKHLPFFHQDILYKSAFLVAKFSKDVLQLPHLFSSIVCLYQDLILILIKKSSPAPIIMFNHLVVNNVKKILQQKNGNTNVFFLQILLNLLTKIFTAPYVTYFMKNYDCNFMQEPACQQALNLLFQFVQNRANEKRSIYELFKRQLKQATDNIRKFLNDIEPKIQPSSQKLSKFYEVKRKQYLQIVTQMNEKPKKIFKKLESISNREIREQIMKKYARIAKKSAHLQMKKMIDLFAANNSTSQQLFAEYVKLLFTNLNKDVDLQEFLRYFSSNFFLNGESQQILRVLDTITVLYYNHQSNKVLKTSDSTYTFANAIILLNSDLHNPQNDTKMSEQAFYKMCKRINNGQDLALQILTSTYHNIKRNKINTFRSKSQLYGISPANFVLLCSREEEQKLQYYDTEMRMLTDQNFYEYFIYDLLSGVIDERETIKLEQLIERFVYDDKTYECQIIQLVRKLKTKKPHVPLHALQKILQWANFKNTKTTEKTISYLWLAVNLLQNFPQYLPTNVMCQLLIFSWRLRTELRDDMYLRQRAQIKRIRKMIREYEKRQSRKSIMDMFSSFLSSKENDSEPQTIEQILLPGIKKMNYKTLTEKIFQALIKSSSNQTESQRKVNHREKAIQFFIGYLRNDEQKLFEEFLSILYLIFHLLWGYNANKDSSFLSFQTKYSQVQSPTEKVDQLGKNKVKRKISSPLKSSLQLSSQIKVNNTNQSSLQETIQDLLYELLGLKESAITKRIQNLKKKDVKKYEILQSYCRYWVVRILLNRIAISKGYSHKENKETKENHELYLLNKSIEYLQRTDKEIFVDLLYQFEMKVKEVFSLAEKIQQKVQINKNQKQQETKMDQQDKKQIEREKIKQNNVQNQTTQINDKQEQKSNQKQQKQNSSVNTQIPKQTLTNKSQQQDKKQQQKSGVQNGSLSFIEQSDNNQQHIHPLVSEFIYNYRKVIQEFYVNCIRLVGQEEINKDKKYRWIVNLQQMLKDVMQNYAELHQKSDKNIKSQNQIDKEKQNQKKEGKQQRSNHQLNQQILEVRAQENSSKQLDRNINKNNEFDIKDGKQKQQAKTKEIQVLTKMQQQIQPLITQQIANKVQPQQQEIIFTKNLNEDEQLMEKINKQLQEQYEFNKQMQQQNQLKKLQQFKIKQTISLEKENFNDSKLELQLQKQQLSQTQQPSIQSHSKQGFNAQKGQHSTINQNQEQKIRNQTVSNNNDHTQSTLIKQEQQALKKLQQIYANNMESPQIPNIPFYMF